MRRLDNRLSDIEDRLTPSEKQGPRCLFLPAGTTTLPSEAEGMEKPAQCRGTGEWVDTAEPSDHVRILFAPIPEHVRNQHPSRHE